MQLLRVCGWSVLLAAAVGLSGCGDSAGAGTVAVTGTVTQKGSPIEGAVVSFHPEGEGETAVGKTDAAGKYALTTRKKDDGAIPGKYKVSITKYEGGPAPSTGAGATLPEGELHSADYTGEAPETPPAKNVLPAKYARPESSGFSATVGSSPSTHDFDLEG